MIHSYILSSEFSIVYMNSQSCPLCRMHFQSIPDPVSSSALGWPTGDGDCYFMQKMQLCDDCMVLLVQQVVLLECHILSWSSLSIFCCIFMVKLFVYILCRTPLNCSSYINLPVVGKPSCLQTTIACLISKAKSHTVPHAPLEQSSTRPSIAVVPPTSLTSPVEQGIPDTERK